MSERLSPDRRSFTQFLPSLFHHIGSRALRDSAGDFIDPQWLPELIQIRQDIKSGRLDLNALIHRLVKLTQKVLGADGAGVWLFTNDEIFYSAGAGIASNDERLRLEVISKLANTWQLRRNSTPRLGNPTAMVTGFETNDDPGWVMSLLVDPVCRGHNVAGALAVFSDKLNAFAERDAASIHLLADVLAQALSKAEEAGLQESVALEPAAVLQLIDKIVPALRRMVENDVDAPPSKLGLPRSETEYEPSAPGIETEQLQESPEAREGYRVIEVSGGTRTVPHQESRPPIRDSAGSHVLQESSAPAIGVPEALESGGVETSTLWAMLRQKYGHKVAFVKNYISRTLALQRPAGHWPLIGDGNAGHPVWHVARYRNSPLLLPGKAAYRSVQGMNAWISRHSFLDALASTWARLQMHPRSLPPPRALWRTAPVLGILVITTTFLILKTRVHDPAQTTASSSRTTTHANTIPLSEGTPEYRETAQTNRDEKASPGEAYVTEPAGTPISSQVSHLRVTDRATKDALRNSSPYELAGLRRRAEFGDDSAAFQMGMAYEIGRGLAQSCTTAARWVTRAASEGNAAAQYNLGLRYRDGDGVPVNQEESARWLRKAAARQGSNARLALTAR